MGGEPLEVAHERAAEAEEPDGDDRHRQRENGRVLRGPRDQVAGRRHQARRRRPRSARRAPWRARGASAARCPSRRSAGSVPFTPPSGPARARASARTRGPRGRRGSTSSGRCAIRSIVRPCRSRSTAARDDRHAGRIQIGGRLVEDHERGVPQEGSREPDPPTLAGRQPPLTVADHASRSRPAARGRTRPHRPERQRRAPARSEALGSPSRMFSATLPRNSVGCWGTQATSRAPRRPVGTRADRHRRWRLARGLARAGRAAAPRPCSCPLRSRRPAPRSLRARARGRAPSSTSPGGRGRRTTPARAAPALVPGSGRAAAPRRRGGRRRRAARTCRSATASPSALAWYSAPSRRNGRYSSGASTSTVSPAWSAKAAVDQAHPGGHGDQRDPERRRQLEHRARQEADPERLHRRPRGSARRPRRATATWSWARSEGAQRRQAADDVEEVGREASQRLPALARPLLGVAADQPHEHRHERQREQHDQRRLEVDDRDPARAPASGTIAGEHDLRQVAREVALERLDALHGGGGDLGALGAVERRSAARRSRRSTSARRSSDSTLQAARRPATSIPHASAPRATKASTSRPSVEPRARASGAPWNARATIRASSVACSSTASARADAERGVDRQQRPRRPRAAQQPRVEARTVSQGCAAAGRAPRPGWRPPPSRWRNTWYVQPW